PPSSPLFPYTTLFRSGRADEVVVEVQLVGLAAEPSHPLHAREELRLEAILRPLDLAGRRPRLSDLADLLVDHARELGEVVPRPRSEEHTSELQSPYDL